MSTTMMSSQTTLQTPEGAKDAKPIVTSRPESQHSHHTDTSSSSSLQRQKQAAKTEKKKHEHTPSAPPAGNSGFQAPADIPRWRFWAIFISLLLSIFLFALDQLILATAIPKITEAFDSLSQLSWLAAGFL